MWYVYQELWIVNHVVCTSRSLDCKSCGKVWIVSHVVCTSRSIDCKSCGMYIEKYGL